MAAIMKLWRQIENPIPSIDADLIEEQSCQISSSRFDLIQAILNRSPQHEQKEQDE